MDCSNFNEKRMLYLGAEEGVSCEELSVKEISEIEAHLESCSVCQDELKKLRETLNLLKKLPERAPSDECLQIIRDSAERRKIPAFRAKLREAFLPHRISLKKVSLAGAFAAVAAFILVSSYVMNQRSHQTFTYGWEDRSINEKIGRIEENLEFVFSDSGTNGLNVDSFQERLLRIEEDVSMLAEEIGSA